MNSKELHNLHEAYLDVYTPQEVDEAVKGASRHDTEMRKSASKERKSGIKNRLSPAAGKDNANKMQRDIKFFDKLTKKNRNVVGLVTKEEYDIFDAILEHLIAEGYADTNESALVIMANMSEEWRDNIVEVTKTVLAPKGGVAGAVQVKQTRTPGFLGTGIGSKTVSTPIPGTFTRNTPGRVQSGPRPFDAYGSGSTGAKAEMGDRSGPTDAERSRFNAAVTKKNTKKDGFGVPDQGDPSDKLVNQRAQQKGHSGLMPTRDNENSTKYTKPNKSHTEKLFN
jgi:hypothetical protein